MKRFSKGTSIGSNNLHTSLDFGDGILMPKLARKSEFDVPVNKAEQRIDKDGNVIGS
jgi:hypothetical protein